MMAGALLVGLLAGLGIVVFRRTVDLATVLCQERGLEAAGGGRWYLLLLPALGGLAVGLWVRALKPQGPGQGVAPAGARRIGCLRSRGARARREPRGRADGGRGDGGL